MKTQTIFVLLFLGNILLQPMMAQTNRVTTTRTTGTTVENGVTMMVTQETTTRYRRTTSQGVPDAKLGYTRCYYITSSSIFQCNKRKKRVLILREVENIINNCFYNAKHVVLNIAASVTHINENAFEGCSHLTSIRFMSDSRLKIIYKEAFNECVYQED